MTDTTLDLKPNERKVLDSLLALGEATAAKVGEHAGLAYPTTTPKLRQLETLGLAERFHNDANQTLWRATGTDAGKNDGNGEAAQATSQATSRAADEPGHAAESGTVTAEGDDAATIEPAPTTADTGELDPQAAATPAPAPAAGEPAEPDTAEPDTVDSEESGDDAAEGAPAVTAEPATTGGDDAPDGQVATGPSDTAAPTAKRKRPAGALEASVLAILRGNPNGQYKINDLRKLVDKADEATGYPAASAGAIANALDKLTGKGQVINIPAKHATFQAAPTAG